MKTSLQATVITLTLLALAQSLPASAQESSATADTQQGTNTRQPIDYLKSRRTRALSPRALISAQTLPPDQGTPATEGMVARRLPDTVIDNSRDAPVPALETMPRPRDN